LTTKDDKEVREYLMGKLVSNDEDWPIRTGQARKTDRAETDPLKADYWFVPDNSIGCESRKFVINIDRFRPDVQ
jgi:hypothetical protein